MKVLSIYNPRPLLILLFALLAYAMLSGCTGSRVVADDTIFGYERWEADRRELSSHEVKAHRTFFREHIEAAHEAAGFSPEESQQIADDAMQKDDQ